ncbi:DUF1592 domain-containing protein [Myxococcota bacterium]|nr:DUF1592 domain-containing protein [Myxococcota bacterium]
MRKNRTFPLLACGFAAGLCAACETGDDGAGAPRDRALTPSASGGAEAPAPPTEAPPAELEAAAPRLPRLTRLQYHNAVRDLFGADVTPPSSLEPDVAVEGLRAIGGTVTSLSPRGVEQAYEGAKALAAQLVAPERRDGLPCFPSTPDDAACLDRLADTQGALIWRRPLTADERAALVAAARAAGQALGDAAVSASTLLTLLLASPSFLYRVELGEPDPARPDDPAARRYTSWEMASRLSFFLWNTVPDETLRTAAAAGELTEPAGLAAQIDRMLTSPRLRDGVRNLFAEWLELYALDELSKDPNIFRHYSADLGASAREETLRLVEHLFLDEDHDFRDLLTTRTTFVDRRLAAIYNVPAATDEGFGRIDLPEDGPRAGLLGQVAFLALHAHPSATSATRRGIAIRKQLLCQAVPSPPANLNTAIPEPSPDARTLKDRLVAHQANPACSGCHVLIDPPGYGLENFDGIGRFRLTDNNAPIDASGDIDGDVFDGPVSLAAVIADHPDFAPCAVRTVYAYAGGHLPEAGEQSELARLAAEFDAGGRRLRGLLRAVALSPGFRTVGEPADTPEAAAPAAPEGDAP